MYSYLPDFIRTNMQPEMLGFRFFFMMFYIYFSNVAIKAWSTLHIFVRLDVGLSVVLAEPNLV